MLTLAREKNLVIRLLHKPGTLSGLARWSPWSGPPAGSTSSWRNKFAAPSSIGNGRTPTQDVEYAVNQLVEMAVRAMSPAINDPFTAMTCLDHIGEWPGAVHPAG